MFGEIMTFNELLDRPIAYQRCFVSLGAGITGALLMSQAVYWSNRTRQKDDWFYKTQEEWTEETGMTRYEQETARKKLVKLGVIEEKKQGIPCKLFFRVNFEKLKKILQTSLWESRKLDCDKPTNSDVENQHANTETTTEITTETTSENKKLNKKVTITVDDMVNSVQGLSEDIASEYLDYRKKRTNIELFPSVWKAIAQVINDFNHKTHIPPDDIIAKAMARAWVGFEIEWLEKVFTQSNTAISSTDKITDPSNPLHWAYGLENDPF